MGMYDGMLPVKQKEGYRGYYPVTNKEEWDELPDLYKAMEWTPIPDPFDKNQTLRAVKNVIFDVVHMEPYGIRAEVSVHPQEIQDILFCYHKKKDCQLYTICGIELEGGSRLPAKWLQDTTTGAFAIYAADKYVAKQGGFYGFIPEHIIVQEDGSYKFDFKYGVGKTTHYTNLNPFRNEPVKEKETDCTKQLMDAMAAYGLEYGWCDNDIIQALVDCGLEYDDFKKHGKEDFVKEYFEIEEEHANNISSKNPERQMKALKQSYVIGAAVKAATREKQEQFVIEDANGEYSFVRAEGDKPATALREGEKIVGKVTWEKPDPSSDAFPGSGGAQYIDFKALNARENSVDAVVENTGETHGYVCKCCGTEIHDDKDNENWFDEFGEEELWGHLQMDHEEVFKECQNWETPAMLEEYYDEIGVDKDFKNKNLTIDNAKKAAVRDGYDQFVIKDSDGGFSFTRIADGKPVTPLFDDEVIIGKVKVAYKNGIRAVSYEEMKSLDEKIAGADNKKSDSPKKQPIKINKDNLSL